jgi:predicted porin
MHLKKHLISLAVTSTIFTPGLANADVYGFVSVGVENTSITGNGASSEIFATGVDGSTHAQDVAESRIGYKGSKELGDGMSASVKLEFGIGTSDFQSQGATNEDASPTTRLAQIGLSGDFGTFTAGTQWGILYEYLGWNVWRTHGHGAGTWYWTTKNINDDAFGLRVDNAFTYTYGGGGYSTDAFTFSVQLIAEPDTNAVAGSPAVVVSDVNGNTFTQTEAVNASPANDELLDAVVFGAAYTSGDLTINAVSYTENDASGAAEPSLLGFGARYNLSPDTYVGGTYMTVDNDAGADISSLNVLLTHNLGNGLSGMIGYGQGDGDNAIADLDSNFFIEFEKDYGQGIIAYVEIETAELSSGDKTQIIAGNLKYNF